MNQQNLADLIWDVADVLRGDFKQSEFGRVILPFTVLRRLECVLEPTREKVLVHFDQMKDQGLDLDLILPGIAGATFYNVSKFTLGSVGSTSTRVNLEDYVSKFSANARQVFEHFAFDGWLTKLESANLLYLVTQKFASIDLHPKTISNHEMGLIFEHLIRKFAESANDTAGEFFTPRDVVRLVTTLVFASDHDALTGEGVVRTVYDCAAGTGGFLSSAIEQVEEWNAKATLVPYAQELNPETYGISVADKLIKGYDTKNIKLGNVLSDDKLPHERFDYCVANPPFGVKWEKVQKSVQDEHKAKGFDGRFGAGLPRIGDGSLLFLMHLLSKRKPTEQGGTRIGIVLAGSPLFTGGAGSGESEIRRWILQRDWLEAILALPTDLFYNTGIGTYVWILSNKKEERRKGRVQLIDGTAMHTPMRKSLGSKRRFLSEQQIAEIARIHDSFSESDFCTILDVADLGYRRVTVERPLRLVLEATPEALVTYRATKGAEHADKFERAKGQFQNFGTFLKAAGVNKLKKASLKAVLECFGTKASSADPVKDEDGLLIPDNDLRQYENIPLKEDIHEYFRREVQPHIPDAWIDSSKVDFQDGQIGAVGYEINFNNYFYKYTPPRALTEITSELTAVELEISRLLSEVTV